ncbi:flippase [Escherichia marmotae]|uniref:Flippase n=1 Tax=Escherichia marmotae TaxID=1499973 RepID=A0AAW5MQE4_9ESCH|nr:flippase [Escherichia marmotae]MBY7302041.1 flippase [Escherichia marmotae]MCR6676518.1 flippase [Escherichia marmotae]MEC9641500.1 flippase [Escherichia marmotae]MEC9835475.1 flippase [Escherichia marmotae]MEC9848238.1 flippase [Escherichia marmotae]
MSLVRNTFWNLSGYIIPSIIAIPSLGFLARSLGPERFGLYTLAIALVGYASIFDAGLTRAVIREVSYFRNEDSEVRKIISNSTIILTLLGVLGGVLIYFGAACIVSFLNVEHLLQAETKYAIELLSLTLPFFLLNQVWLGVMEGYEQFKKINIIKTFNSSFIVGLPALLVYFKSDLLYAIMGLVLARFLSLIITFCSCKKNIITSGFLFDASIAKRLLKYGGWITVSNVVSPLMAYLDRFFISNIMGASNVAFYTAPAEGVQRLSVFPGALSRAIFPKLSRLVSKPEKSKQKKLAYGLMAGAIFPLCMIGFLSAEEIMTLWMGSAFSGLSASILQILLVGFFFNCIAQIPFADIQAAGKSKITALLHLCEVIPYLLLLFLSIHIYGIIGAAFAWSMRTTIDCFLLIWLNNKI